MRIRSHWITLIPAPMLALIAVTATLLYAKIHPAQTVAALHINNASAITPYVRIFYSDAAWIIGILITLAILIEASSIATWATKYINLDDRSIEYCEWPTKSESIPLSAIADVQYERPGLLAIILGYGTLRIDAGRAEERIRFVPDVENVAKTIRQYGR